MNPGDSLGGYEILAIAPSPPITRRHDCRRSRSGDPLYELQQIVAVLLFQELNKLAYLLGLGAVGYQ